jgi:hypothetical protein
VAPGTRTTPLGLVAPAGQRGDHVLSRGGHGKTIHPLSRWFRDGDRRRTYPRPVQVAAAPPRRVAGRKCPRYLTLDLARIPSARVIWRGTGHANRAGHSSSQHEPVRLARRVARFAEGRKGRDWPNPNRLRPDCPTRRLSPAEDDRAADTSV